MYVDIYLGHQTQLSSNLAVVAVDMATWEETTDYSDFRVLFVIRLVTLYSTKMGGGGY